MSHCSLRRLQSIGAVLAVALLLGLSGCAMCCAPYDCDFGYTGGAWVRDNPSQGRVGSAFEPAGYKQLVEVAKPEQQEPTPAQPMNDASGQSSTPDMDSPPPPEATPPESTDPNTTYAPRMRAVHPYLPQN